MDGHTEELQNLEVSTECVQLLMELGYVATGCGQKEVALAIFRGVIAARPYSQYPWIGQAVVLLNFGDFIGATKILLNHAIPLSPEPGLAHCFLALASQLMGQKEHAIEIMRTVLKDSSDPAAVKMAENFIANY